MGYLTTLEKPLYEGRAGQAGWGRLGGLVNELLFAEGLRTHVGENSPRERPVGSIAEQGAGYPHLLSRSRSYEGKYLVPKWTEKG